MFYAPPQRHARFRQTRVLIVGCGDVGMRVAKLMKPHVRLMALTSSPERITALREQGIIPLLGNLDDSASLRRLSSLAARVVHLVPPGRTGFTDSRTQNLMRALSLRGQLSRLVYGSTTGVYGDAGGNWLDEAAPLRPMSDRAQRRVHAESVVRAHCVQACVLRIPGIYSLDREGGDPRQRVMRASPVLTPEYDVFTNHIHADDLARACVLAIWRGRPRRVTNVCDDTELRMGDYFDWVADHFGLPRPPRVSLDDATSMLTPMQMSFMRESRRLHNHRLKRELRLRLRYPTIKQGLAMRDTA